MLKMFSKIIFVNYLLTCVLSLDLMPMSIIPKISAESDENVLKKNFKTMAQKHSISGKGTAAIEKKEGIAEKTSNYEKDRGFFLMKAYGWDREKKNKNANAEGKYLKAKKAGKLYKTGGEFSGKFSERQGNNEIDKKYDHNMLYDQGDFGRRIDYKKPQSFKQPTKINHEIYSEPEVEYTESPPPYGVIEPKINFYKDEKYTRIHYPTSGIYLPGVNYKNSYDLYKDRKKYPIDKLWNQGYYSRRYYTKPITVDNHIENNLLDFYDNKEKLKYQPLDISHESPDSSYLKNDDHYSNNEYSNDYEDEGRHYYDRKITDFDIDKLRSSYSKYNNDYAGSQLLTQKTLIDSYSTEQPIKKGYRLWIGSHYY